MCRKVPGFDPARARALFLAVLACAACGETKRGSAEVVIPAIVSVFPPPGTGNVNPTDLNFGQSGVQINFGLDVDPTTLTASTVYAALASAPDTPIQGQTVASITLGGRTTGATIALFSPSAGTDYSVTVTNAVRRSDGLPLLASNYRWSFSTVLTNTVTIVWNPTGGNVGLSTTTLTAQFNGAAMNGATVNATSFLLYTVPSTGVAHPATLGQTVSFAGNTATMTLPAGQLLANTTYRMAITKNVSTATSPATFPFAADQSNDFSTGQTSTTGPGTGATSYTPTSRSPDAGANSVAVSTSQVSVSFPVDMQGGSFTSTSFTISPNKATAAPSYNAATKTATLPIGGLAAGTPYTVTLTSAVKDLAGVTAFPSGETWTFTTLNSAPPAPGSLVINEFLINPDADMNIDGLINGSSDEYVEIVNKGLTAFDLSGYELWDETAKQYSFPQGVVVGSNKAVLVFGGWEHATDPAPAVFSNVKNAGAPVFFKKVTGGATATASSKALNLNNTGGDTIQVKDPGGAVVASYSYGVSKAGLNSGNPVPKKGEAYTRDPDGTGPDPMVEHSGAINGNGAGNSPGFKIDGNQF